MNRFPLHKPDFWCFSENGTALGGSPRMVFMTKNASTPVGSFYFNESDCELFESLAGVVEAMRPKYGAVVEATPRKSVSVWFDQNNDGSQSLRINLVRAGGNSVHEFIIWSGMTGRDFVNEMRTWLDQIDPPAPVPEGKISPPAPAPETTKVTRVVKTGELSATLGASGEALILRAGRDGLVTLWPKDGPTVWAESFRAAAEKLNPSGPPAGTVLAQTLREAHGVELQPGEVVALPAPTPNREQQKAAWAFVGATLRLAQANLRDGFDRRMIEAAQVMCEANERAS